MAVGGATAAVILLGGAARHTDALDYLPGTGGLGAPGVRLLAQVSSQGASAPAAAVARAHEVVTCAVAAEVMPPAGLAEVEAVLADVLARASRAEVAA